MPLFLRPSAGEESLTLTHDDIPDTYAELVDLFASAWH
jgi:hypothetical protein